MPAPAPDADAQSTTVGIVAPAGGDHPGGVPCGACVTCACDAAPRVDEDGLCLGCGGVPVAVALLWGEPHVGPAEELAADDRSKIALLIEEERRFQAGDRPTMLPPDGEGAARRDAIRRVVTRLLTPAPAKEQWVEAGELMAAVRGELGGLSVAEVWRAFARGELRWRRDAGFVFWALAGEERDARAGWPTVKGWAAKVTRREYVRHGALHETPWRLRLEDDRQESGFLTISEETLTSHRPTARTLAVITALDLTEQEAIWLRDVLAEALMQEPVAEAL